MFSSALEPFNIFSFFNLGNYIFVHILLKENNELKYGWAREKMVVRAHLFSL